MKTELSEVGSEVLWDDGEFILSRVNHRADRSPTLLVRPASSYPTTATLARLEHARSLKSELDASWAARPSDFVNDCGTLTLCLEDPGGQMLSTLIGKPWDVELFLRVAIGLVTALNGLHNRRLVHKDVKPSNFLVDVATGQAWLTNFGYTTRVAHERMMPGAPPTIAGTLAYIAPEQTGRMNRSVDTRSDLYSLGVTLYEMLTGMLPFRASEPMEWIHCHIARQAAAPDERVNSIPRMLSAITLKLLAKNTEDRYQTARGVEADLRRCLSEWKSTNQIEEFPLATRDIPDYLLLPERLYGREGEIATLVEAFKRVAGDGRQRLVLVSGYSGAGKSSVVNELQQVVIRSHGFFVSGKFDPHERDTPFAPIIRAFRDLVRSVLLLTDTEVQKWRNEIQVALGPNAQLMIDLVPEVKLVIGPQEPVADLPPQQAQARFQRVLQHFVGVFARPEHPLVLFVDDLQWLDRASLDLLRNLATQDEGMHLLLVGAYRQNEVGPTHPLRAVLFAIEGTVSVQELVIGSLQYEDLQGLISDALHHSRDHTNPLAEVVYEKTAGNPFFVIQFLHELAGESLLVFDGSAGAWTWDLPRIKAKRYTDNVFDLLAGKMDRLSLTTQEALRNLACLDSGRTDALSIVQGCLEDEVHVTFSEATDAGLVSRSEEGYAFCHDRIREAAYALVPEHERAAVHLRIGRALLAKMPAVTASEQVFDIINQLNRGVAVVTSAAERVQIAELNLIAGRRARTTSAYKSALVHLAAGESLLGEEDWAQHDGLRFSLAFYRAECEFLTGELLAAEERLTRLHGRATRQTDLSAVACLRIAVCTTLDRTDRATEIGLEQLKAFAIDVPAHPGEREIREEYTRLQRHLAERPLQVDAWKAPRLLDLSSTSDADLLAAMEVLLAMLPAAVFTNKNLHDFIVIRLANLSLEFGHYDGSILAYAHLSMVLGPRFGDHHDGFQFGNLTLAIAERKEFTRSRAKVYTVVAYHVLPWTSPINAAYALMQRARGLALETGDLLFAAFSSTHLISLRLAAGDTLQEVQSEAEHYLSSSRRAGFGLLVYCLLGQLHLLRSLSGQGMTNSQPDEATVEKSLEQDPRLAIAACWYWIRKLQACFHTGDYKAALDMGTRAERLLWTCPTFFEFAEYHFYIALAHAQAWDSARDAEASVLHREALANQQVKLATWAANSEETFASRAALAAAELARLEGRLPDAEHLYEECIRLATAAGQVNVEAIASELAGQFYRGRGLERIAQTYFASAIRTYHRWGAEAVAVRLGASSGIIAETPFRPVDTAGTTGEGLDLATVIKASHTISGEILIDKLVETLMVTTVEHAGAERGLLIIQRGEESRVEAEATTQLDAVTVGLLGRTMSPSDLPQTVLHYVLRTQELVILNDAAVPNPFSGDGYLVNHGVRSLLCLPLVKQATLVGMLYLENNVASNVFTPSRVALLKLLASQAAISLENARLYGDLREAQAYLAEAQRLSATGSFGWKPTTGEIVWSDETYRTFALDRAMKPTLEFALSRAHAEDRDRVQHLIDRATHEAKDWDLEHRIVMPEGTVKHLHVVAHAVCNELTGETDYVGAVMDVTAARESHEALERAYREIQGLKDELQKENIVLREEIDRSSMFEEIVGESPAVQGVLLRVAKVAPTDSTVLITGETGTGKELIARAIHKRSRRAEHAFVSVNCAAVPPSLIASELFGHEKGAFTGAIQRRLGRFELAEGGTIFLDEVGDLPAETQIALLRVLQEREFERVGGSKVIRANVRVIAATNRDLQAAIGAGMFRNDLYYRFNVFPIEVPPLRKRKEDIPLLAGYFIDRYSSKAGKKIGGIDRTTLERLMAYSWPGNVRELQNVIERSMIVCEAEKFTVDESWLTPVAVDTDESVRPLFRMSASDEKKAIEAALADARGRVSGPSGAAAKLGIPPSTLDSKIKILRINKHQFKVG